MFGQFTLIRHLLATIQLDVLSMVLERELFIKEFERLSKENESLKKELENVKHERDIKKTT